MSPDPDHWPPHSLEERHEETAAAHHGQGQAGLTVPVEDGVDEVITPHRTGGVQGVEAGVGGQILTSRHTDPNPSCCPVNQGEYRVVDTECNRQVEVVDTDGSRGEISFL